MTAQRRGEVGFGDRRRFHLMEYRHGHSQALVRGIPEPDEEDGDAALRVIDFLFVGVARVSCWRDFARFELRRPAADEMTVLEGRLGRLRPGEAVFLLEAGTIESHIVAARVYWAEFDLGGGAPSPLASEDPDYREAYPPVGTIQFAD